MPRPSARKSISRIVPALTARTQFGQILKRVHRNKERFVVERRGEPLALILSIDDYLRNFAKPVPAIDEIHAYVKEKKLKPLSMRVMDSEIKRARKELRQKQMNG